jgi:polyisoprenoid-binding protein YceI
MRSCYLGIGLCLLLLGHTPTSRADQYTIDPNHTYPTIEYNHFGFSVQRLRFDNTTGQIDLNPSELNTGTIDVAIDANSVDSGNAEFNEHLRGSEFFDVAKYPKITFKSTRLRLGGGKIIEIAGNLTIKSITRPVNLAVVSFRCMQHPVKLTDACGANAETRIKRSDFGLGKHAPAVSDEVTVRIAVEAIKN